MIYLLTFLLSFLFAFFFTFTAKKFAIKFKIYDNPISDIKNHKDPTPYLGGLAIAGSFYATLIIVRFCTHFETGVLRSLRGIFLASFISLLIGLFDDLKDWNFKKKFVWQFVSATILIFYGMKIKFIEPDYISIILSYFWIIGIINAVNLIDIMDGLSSGIAIIASFAFFFIHFKYEASYVNFAAISLAGACLGFLKHNFYPAKIFMGDAGSMFIGTVLAAVSLGANYSTKNEISIFTPILILIVPIYDTIYIMIKRAQKGKSIFLGSKDHVAVRLKIKGWPVKKIVFTLYFASFFAAITAYLITKSSFIFAIYLYIFVAVLCVFFARELDKIEVDN